MRMCASWVGALLVCGIACGGKSAGTQQNNGPSAHALTVAVTGPGAVKSAPAGIDCGTSCTASFAHGASVLLTAVPDSNAVFSGWDGACSGTGACTVAMNADAAVSARFAAAPPPPGQNFTVTVATKGSGTVKSSPSGIDCGHTCSGVFASGTKVSLVAQPDSGWTFSGWSGSCSGMGDCSVNADASVGAEFTAIPPPPPARRTLSVTPQGNGKVASTPAGIDCGTTCNAAFDDGARVELTAQADAGWKFSGFSGACTGATCAVTMSGDQSVTATFTAVQPADECDGLQPGTLPAPVVASLPQNSCLDGTSDDGTGNYLLGYTAGPGPTYPNYLFFTIQDGKAVRIGDTVPGGDESATYVFSQPSGFTSFHLDGPYGGSSLRSYTHEGNATRRQVIGPSGPHDVQNTPTSAVGIDPSGGTAIALHKNVNGLWGTTYQRLDKTGAPETGEVSIDDQNHPVAAVGVALSGHALVIAQPGNGALKGRWLARDGSPLTGWFELDAAAFPVARFLMDGSVVVGDGPFYQGVTWKYLVRDSQTTSDTLPSWLQARPGNLFFVIRNGRGYASRGQYGQCGIKSLEVLATSGKSCGCVNTTNGGGYVGRDGSLIVPRAPVNFGTCQYELYPQLLK